MNAAAATRSLGLEPPFGLEDVKRAFREVALRVHPDHGGSDVAMRAAIEARDELLSCLSRNPQAFARAEKPKPKQTFSWRRSAKGNLTTPLNNGYWGTIFKTALGDYKYVTRNDFSARSFATEDAAREAAEERWGAA